MKKLAELLALILQQNSPEELTWMVNFSGHVNLLDIRFYPKGYDNSEYDDCEIFSAYIRKNTERLPNDSEIGAACKFIEKHIKTLAS